VDRRDNQREDALRALGRPWRERFVYSAAAPRDEELGPNLRPFIHSAL